MGVARLLVLHRQPELRAAVAGALRRSGYEVLECASAEDLAAGALGAVDCALVEPELAEAAELGLGSQSGPAWSSLAVPVLLLTGPASDPRRAAQALRRGASGCLRWPAEAELLPGVVGATLAAARRDRQLQRLVTEVASRTGREFFAAAVRFLGEELGAHACLAGELVSAAPERIRTLAYWRAGKLEADFEYALDGTPCEQVVGRSFCVFEDQVAERFPRDAWLQREGIRGYMGEPLFGAGGRPLGLLNAAFRRPLTAEDHKAATLFRLLAARAAAELEREQALQAARTSERRAAALFRNSPVPTLLVRLSDRVVLDANRAWLELMGLAPEQVVGRRTSELPLGLEESLRQDLAAELASRRSLRNLEVPLTTGHGEARRVLASFDVLDAEGEQLLIATTQDITALRRAEQELRQSEERFRLLIEHAPEALVLLDVQSGRFLLANRAAEQLFKLPAAELVRRGPVELSPPLQPDGRPSAEKAAELIAQAVAGEQPVFEWLHRDAEGRDIPCEVRLLRLDLGGRLVVRGSVLEISERKAAQVRMERLNRLYALLTAANEAILREPDLEVLLPAICRLAVEQGGFALAWIGLADRGGRLRVAAQAGADESSCALLRQFVEGPRPDCAFTYRALEHGTPAPCPDIAASPLAEGWRRAALERGYRSMASFPVRARGRVAGTLNLYAREPGFTDEEELRLLEELAADVGLGLEIHEREAARRAAEQALRQSEQRFRRMIEYAPDMIHVVDEGGRLLFQSPSGEQFLGYAGEERLGRSVAELIHPEDLPRVTAALGEAVAQPGKAVRFEYRLRHKQGDWRTLESVCRSLPEEAPGGFIVINSRDVTEHRQLQAQLLQAQKLEAIGRLAGGIAHDFNNLLTVILGNVDLCRARGGLSAPVEQALAEIRDSARRAAELTRQLLAFSRRQHMQQRPVDLNELLGHLGRMLRRLIGEDIELELKLHPAPLCVNADRAMLEQVVMNLAVNARDAMPEGGRLTIETTRIEHGPADAEAGGSPGGPWAVVRVSDTGVGIPAEHLPVIFEPFFTTKEVGKGTGLGLATAYGIVKQHGGTIQVASRVREGTVFEIALPMELEQAQPAGALPEASPAPAPRAGAETVLVVEDEPSVRATVSAILQRHGYRVLAAGSGPEALALWRKHRARIELVVTDMVMPGGLSGQRLLQQLRQERPELPVLCTSGYSAEFAHQQDEPAPSVQFLPKPFTAEALLEAVRRCLGD
ncbi:MAG: hypothetical protein KatS3mg102_2008 [Planctomycetota bacterium]|nr:MAG: hypothetical protein KatS3mg102_2008 [Planctomycetota bacterium]